MKEHTRCRSALIEGISVSVGTPVPEVLARAERKMKRSGIPVGSLHFRLYKKSVDARKREDIRLVYTVLATATEGHPGFREDQLIRSMEQFHSGDAGQLTIGITPFRSSYMVSEIVHQVRKAYPNITIKLHEAGSEQLRKDAAEGKFDFAVVNLPVENSILDVIPLESDRLVLLGTREFFDSFHMDPDVREIDFSQARSLPFIVVGHTQEMRILFERLCAMSDFHPNIAVEVVSLTTAWTMACTGAGATILPEQFVSAKLRSSQSIRAIGIRNTVYTRQPAIVTRRGQYLSKYARYAIELMTKMPLL